MPHEQQQQQRRSPIQLLMDILIFVGPSGSGKSTLIEHLLQIWPQHFGLCPSYTTRKPRRGEVDGKHYHFVSKETFRNMIDSGAFLEYSRVFCTKKCDDGPSGGDAGDADYYGTSKEALCKLLSQKKVVLMDTDIMGAINIRKSCTSSSSSSRSGEDGSVLLLPPNRIQVIFVKTPCLAALETRLRHRGTESEASLQKRLCEGEKWLHWYNANPSFFHFILVNHDLEACQAVLRNFVTTRVMASSSNL